ncbi:nickel-dependent lactate racemase [candidate division KSB1 bacterium]|nr:nickel-dependent lactate racemase [candidate division KSB1 bacterium]
MQVKLEYGQTGLPVTLPAPNVVKVLSMKSSPIIEAPAQKLIERLQRPIASPPLAGLARGKKSACVVICDITRPVPNRIILPPVLATLRASGIPREKITILIATGIHRPNLDAELLDLVGEEIAREYPVVNHFSKDKTQQVFLGHTRRGTPIWINQHFVNSELKITTGFIEPHLMAGFSGGRKLICPGISSLETVKVMHSPQILEHPNAREGVIEGNPFHEEVLEIARQAGVHFIVNVALNEQRQIVGIFAGHPEQAHLEGIQFVRAHVGDSVAAPVDVVITTAAGFPLDATFYQSIKGLTAALPIVKPGGTIILAAECREGLGSPEFTRLVHETRDLNQFMENIWRPDYFVVDQWQFEELAKVMRQVRVIVVSNKLTPEVKAALLPLTLDSVEAAVADCLEKYGSTCRIAVIPKGPYILAQLETAVKS